MAVYWNEEYARITNTSDVAEFTGESLRPVNLLYLDTLSEADNSTPDPLYLNSGVSDIIYDSNTYLGIGTLGSIDRIEENQEVRANGVKLTLSGIPSGLAAKALTTDYRGRTAILYLALVNDDNTILVTTEIFNASIDKVEVSQGVFGTITVSVENVFIEWNRADNRLLSHQEQIQNYPDDEGFIWSAVSAEKQIRWGDLI